MQNTFDIVNGFLPIAIDILAAITTSISSMDAPITLMKLFHAGINSIDSS